MDLQRAMDRRADKPTLEHSREIARTLDFGASLEVRLGRARKAFELGAFDADDRITLALRP